MTTGQTNQNTTLPQALYVVDANIGEWQSIVAELGSEREVLLLDNDTIRLENAVFTQLLSTGTLAASMFQASVVGAADDADDYIVYNTTTGALSYDADGVGAAAAVQFAQLVGSPAITSADFVVV
jgi:hypothetical protein